MVKKKRKKAIRTPAHASNIVSDEFHIPNHSGDHSAGTTGTPVNDRDIANKKYVDDSSGLWEVDGTETQLKTADEIDMQTKKIINVVDPTVDQDAATKKYVDDATPAHTESSTDSLTNKTIDSFTNQVEADEIHIEVRNESGSTMTKGQVVYISGYSVGQDKPLVSLADADGAGTFPAIGLISDASIANNATGHCTMQGRMTGIATDAFAAGATAYLSTTAGALSAKPTGAGEEVQAIGIVLRSHGSLGVLEIVGAGRINQSPNAGHDDFTDFVAAEHRAWENSIAQNIHTDNYIENVTTNLSLGVGNATTEIIVCSDGTDVTLIEADTDNAGLLGAVKWDEIVAATTHVADTSGDPHNIAADTLTFTNKTIDQDGAGNSITNIANASIKAGAGIVMSKTAFVAGTNCTLSTNTLNVDDAFLKNDAVDIGVGLTLTGDNASADTNYVPMVLYNTDGTPPAASGFPIGTIYIQYTA